LTPAGFVTALPAEARTLLGGGWLKSHPRSTPIDFNGHVLFISGMGPERAAYAARQLIDHGARGLVCWGCAGGLSTGLEAGSVVIPEIVIGADRQEFEVDARWHSKVLAMLRGHCECCTQPLLSGTTLVASSLAKQSAAASSGACAIDMESSAIAAVATAAKLPFLVVRTIADPQSTNLPNFLSEVTDPYGLPKPGRLGIALLRQPTAVPQLLALQGCWTRSLQSLRKVARLLRYT
jgi:nucleoside phosphorylase